jgi:hypothetical protein
VTAREDTTRPFGIIVLWILSVIRIAYFFALANASHLAYLECIKGPIPYCPRFELYFIALGFFDIVILVLLLRPGHYRLLLASAFDVFLYAISTLAAAGYWWRFYSVHFYAIAIWLISIVHAAMFLVPVVREYYRTPALLGSQS